MFVYLLENHPMFADLATAVLIPTSKALRQASRVR
jgi:hypothetical protein